MATVETSVGHVEIGGAPTDAEIAAIVAAVEMTWPKPAPPSSGGRVVQSTAWRHADRWWAEGRLPSCWK